MEIQGTVRTVPPRPIALAMALFAVIALALTGWYVFGTRAQVSSGAFDRAPLPNHLPLNCSGDPYSPHDPICQPYHDPISPHDPLS